jgi:hypothetical protein
LLAFQTFCREQGNLLACALLLFGLIGESDLGNFNDSGQSHTYKKLCVTVCKFLQTFSGIYDKKNVTSEAHATIINTCASLLTQIIIASSADSAYKSEISSNLKEYETLQQLIQYASQLSDASAERISRAAKTSEPSRQEKEILAAVTSVFDLLHAIADSDYPDMIAKCFAGVELPQLVVRNPLFAVRSSVWSLQDPSLAQPRGVSV